MDFYGADPNLTGSFLLWERVVIAEPVDQQETLFFWEP